MKCTLAAAYLVSADFSRGKLENTDITGAILDDAVWIDGKKRCGKKSLGSCR
jgi:uncharacterized protein YjbI with pentapeptide repeats